MGESIKPKGLGKCFKKNDFEILFRDSSEYFAVENAKMIVEGSFVRFVCFDSKEELAKFIHDIYYPVDLIYRIKRLG